MQRFNGSALTAIKNGGLNLRLLSGARKPEMFLHGSRNRNYYFADNGLHGVSGIVESIETGEFNVDDTAVVGGKAISMMQTWLGQGRPYKVKRI